MSLKISIYTLTLIFFFSSNGFSQSFGTSNLSGETLAQPTSLQFGPDGRLYVSEVEGLIYAYTINRNGSNNYQIIDTEVIDLINDIQNHDDDGDPNNNINDRQVTGLLVTGTSTNPVLYVSSSDSRIGGGGGGSDVNLDTNSGVISRITKTGNSWNKVDLVRGLPRSEENHATNGMQLDLATNTLFVASGGHTNAGAPSNNFAFTTEYALSAAVLTVDLNMINSLPVLNDNGTQFVYDIPTLDDPTRPNVNGQDVNDPFGGNDGLNQAKIVPDGPVQIYAPGFRNIYDLVLTEAGNLYTWDNGANGGWGGHPANEGGGNATNNWISGEPGSNGPGPNDPKVNNLDGLHFITGPNYYGGHPNPIRANPSGAGLFTQSGGGGGETGVWRTSVTGNVNTTLPVDWPPVPDANPIEGDFQNPGEDDSSLFTLSASTNGMAEYTATNFGGTMQGDILAASFNDNLYRVNLNGAGSINNNNDVSVLGSGFGNNPLDVVAQGDDDIFPGTIWLAGFGTNNIIVFEPTDYEGGGTNPGNGDNIYINAGGNGFTANGITWQSDQYFQGGTTYSQNVAIANSNIDALYQTERFGQMSYNIPVANGDYEVQLHFAEIWSGGQTAGSRVFDVTMEGNLVLNNFDITANAGFQTATVQTFNVTINDGTLNINFGAEIQNPKISGIAVIGQSTACVGNYSNSIDEDGDGFTNGDEIDNGTNPCNGASMPQDFDGTTIGGFKVSDLNDPDDDDDGILDTNDKFAWDETNGLNQPIPVNYPLLNGEPGFGFFGLGFTGLMTNNSDDYLNLIQDEDNSATEIIAGGAVGLFTLNGVPNGDPINSQNSAKNGFQFGLNVNANSSPFEIETGILGPIFINAPSGNQAVGIYFGNGDQDNYLKLTIYAGGGNPGLQILHENAGGVALSSIFPNANIGNASEVKLKLVVDPSNGSVQAQYATGNGSFINIGNEYFVNGAILNALQSNTQAVAVGIISTTFNSDPNFNATWDYINVNSVDTGCPTVGQACNDGNGNTRNDTFDANCNCVGVPICTGSDIPTATVSSSDETAPQANDGTITFTFNDDATLGGTRTNLAFSIDGGNSWPYNVSDSNGSFTVSGLAPGQYNTMIRWGNNQCPFDLTTVTIDNADGGGSNTCQANFSVSGNTINVSNVSAPISTVKVFNNAFNTLFSCDNFGGTPCANNESITVPNTGTYFIQIQTYQDWNTPVCNIFEQLEVTGGGTTPTCNNVNNGGSISGEETLCSGDNAEAITNSSFPSGGSGTMQYLWLSSTSSCPNSLNDQINGANASTYDPGTLTQTTYFRRLSRRAGCTDWFAGESNCVVKTVENCGGGNNTCQADFSVSGNTINVANASAPISTVKVYDNTFATIFSCDNFGGTACDNNESITVPSAGTYFIQIQTFVDWFTPVCNVFEQVNIGTNNNRSSDQSISDDSFMPMLSELEQPEIHEFRLSPNPAKGFVNISLSDFQAKNLQIQLVDQIGKLVRNIKLEQVNQPVYQMMLSNVPNGFYSVRVFAERQKPVSKKLIISNSH